MVNKNLVCAPGQKFGRMTCEKEKPEKKVSQGEAGDQPARVETRDDKALCA